MNASGNLLSYGVRVQNRNESATDAAVESIKLRGYAIIDGGYNADWMQRFSKSFDEARLKHIDAMGGFERLESVGEQNTVRLPLSYERTLLDLATNETVLTVCHRLMGEYIILNQQNGIINPPFAEGYNQGFWHRDLAYQHYTSSRPLAINALFCIDEFRVDNGATLVIPASHKMEAFPSDELVASSAVKVVAPAGSFIVLDCMTYHTGGVNESALPRRAVNHAYSIPLMKQQIDIPRALGDNFSIDPDVRKLLGYGSLTPLSVEEYIEGRRRRRVS